MKYILLYIYVCVCVYVYIKKTHSKEIRVFFFFCHRFILPGEMDIDSISYEELSPPEEEPAEKEKEKELKKRRELLKLVNLSK